MRYELIVQDRDSGKRSYIKSVPLAETHDALAEFLNRVSALGWRIIRIRALVYPCPNGWNKV